MMKAPQASTEQERLEALLSLDLLDTPQEERFDRLTRKAAQIFDVPIAYLSLIDANRQWLKSVVGPMECEMARANSFCSHTILEDRALIIADTLEDPLFAGNPLVVGEPHIRFYAGIPLNGPGGHIIGTFCIADRKPRRFSPAELEVLKSLASVAEERVNSKPKIFISYSHQDEEWKDRLVRHLSVLQNQDLLELWEDRRIGVGDAWRNEIQDAIESSNVAILLISANFLTSQFIMGEEVPRLLERSDKEGMHILPLITKPCCWDQVGWLEPMNMYPKDARPLSGQDEHQVDNLLAAFAAKVIEKTSRRRRPSTQVPQQARRAAWHARAAYGTFITSPDNALPPLKVRVRRKDEPSAQPEEFVFRQERITIGRDPTSTLFLEDEKRLASKLHAEVVGDGTTFRLRDLGSKNATFVNGKKLQRGERYELHPGDVIWIGAFEIRVASAGSNEDDTTQINAPDKEAAEDTNPAHFAEAVATPRRRFPVGLAAIAVVALVAAGLLIGLLGSGASGEEATAGSVLAEATVAPRSPEAASDAAEEEQTQAQKPEPQAEGRSPTREPRAVPTSRQADTPVPDPPAATTPSQEPAQPPGVVEPERQAPPKQNRQPEAEQVPDTPPAAPVWDREQAEKDIRILAERYKRSIEAGNVKGLASSDELAKFFKHAEDRKVSGDPQIAFRDVREESARVSVSFRVGYSAFGDQHSRTFVRLWELARQNGQWVIESDNKDQ